MAKSISARTKRLEEIADRELASLAETGMPFCPPKKIRLAEFETRVNRITAKLAKIRADLAIAGVRAASLERVLERVDAYLEKSGC